MSSKLLEAFEELRDYGNDLVNSTYDTFDSALQRFVYNLQPGTIAGDAVLRAVPNVDFDRWYDECASTGGSMVGSATLSWPADTAARVGLQRELLFRMAGGSPKITTFCSTFMWSSGRFDDMVSNFVRQVFVPFHCDMLRIVKPELEKEDERHAAPPPAGPPSTPRQRWFVHETRLVELRNLPTHKHDFRKLVRLCEELNIVSSNECHFSTAMLVRSILDHVPPVFSAASFNEVANNYVSSRSFSDSMRHLSESARKIADSHLHTQLRSREILPTETQVDFSRDLDVLLAEIVRISGSPP